MARIFDLNTYQFQRNERLFYDTNVWAAINDLTSFSSDSAPYTAAHKRVLTASCALYTDLLILQEFANVLERESVALVRKNRLGLSNKLSGKETKVFRRTPEFIEAATAVADALHQILRQATIAPSTSDTHWFRSQIDEYESGQVGFNDRLIAQICLDNDFTLVTHDAEFVVFDLKIITALPALLQIQT